MKVGDYTRSSWGTFSKIKEYRPYEDSEEFSILLEGEKYSIHYKNKNQFNEDYKTSSNIIDLIKIGDYVNDFLVLFVKEDEKEVVCGLLLTFKEKDIKTIVTRERFEEVAYKI